MSILNSGEKRANGEIVTHKDKIGNTVRECIAEILKLCFADVKPESSLLELGAESLDFVHLVLRLETTFHIAIPREYAIPDSYTVDSLVQAVSLCLDAQGKTE